MLLPHGASRPGLSIGCQSLVLRLGKLGELSPSTSRTQRAVLNSPNMLRTLNQEQLVAKFFLFDWSEHLHLQTETNTLTCSIYENMWHVMLPDQHRYWTKMASLAKLVAIFKNILKNLSLSPGLQHHQAIRVDVELGVSGSWAPGHLGTEHVALQGLQLGEEDHCRAGELEIPRGKKDIWYTKTLQKPNYIMVFGVSDDLEHFIKVQCLT